MAGHFVEQETTPTGAGTPVESAELTSPANARDRAAEARDRAASARDTSADDREQQATQRDVDSGREVPTRDSYRRGAAEDRAASAADRASASRDRAAAAEERAAAQSVIESLLQDELTGIYVRSAGVSELKREILRARRTGEPFTLAFVDVDHLKATNDAHGHPAGDRLLARVARAIRSVVRDYDIIVRYGGDEFLCGTTGLTLADAQARYDHLNAHIAAAGGGAASVGVAQLVPEEDLDALIARADTAMFIRKRRSS